MDKKDIYEHLAKIYLDASSKRKGKDNAYPKIFKYLFYVSILFVFGLSGVLLATYQKNRPLNSEVALVFLSGASKINYHFNPAKKEMYSLSLNKLDLTKFKELGFALRRTNFEDNISLRVEFTNAFNETSETYLSDIPHKWQEYKIKLSKFKNISDWSEMTGLSFIIEEWNTKEKKGEVYIDNVRLLK